MRSLFEIKDNYFDVQNVLFSKLETIGGAIYITRQSNSLNFLKVAFIDLISNIPFHFVDTNYGTCAFFHHGSIFLGKQILIQNCSSSARAVASSYVDQKINNLQHSNYTTISESKMQTDCLYLLSLGNVQFNHINGSFLNGNFIVAPHAGYGAYSLYQTYCSFTNSTSDIIFNHQTVMNEATVNHIVLAQNHPSNLLASSGKLISIVDSIFFGNDKNDLNNIKVINCQYDKNFGDATSEGCVLIDKYEDGSLYGAYIDIISKIQNFSADCTAIIHHYYDNPIQFMTNAVIILFDI